MSVNPAVESTKRPGTVSGAVALFWEVLWLQLTTDDNKCETDTQYQLGNQNGS